MEPVITETWTESGLNSRLFFHFVSQSFLIIFQSSVTPLWWDWWMSSTLKNHQKCPKNDEKHCSTYVYNNGTTQNRNSGQKTRVFFLLWLVTDLVPKNGFLGTQNQSLNRFETSWARLYLIFAKCLMRFKIFAVPPAHSLRKIIKYFSKKSLV